MGPTTVMIYKHKIKTAHPRANELMI
jgi:sRNA-binding regulator protein Hfq